MKEMTKQELIQEAMNALSDPLMDIQYATEYALECLKKVNSKGDFIPVRNSEGCQLYEIHYKCGKRVNVFAKSYEQIENAHEDASIINTISAISRYKAA